MKEVEVKAKLKDGAAAKAKLEALGCMLSEPIIQDDKIYLRNGLDLSAAGRGLVALRIRNANGKYILTLKKQLENQTDNLEYEIVIDDPVQAHDILTLMDYHEVSQVYKVRRQCHYNGLEICLDEVRDLGSFIEAEKLTEDEDSLKVQTELFAFLKTLGVAEEDRVMKGYDILLYEQGK